MNTGVLLKVLVAVNLVLTIAGSVAVILLVVLVTSINADRNKRTLIIQDFERRIQALEQR